MRRTGPTRIGRIAGACLAAGLMGAVAPIPAASAEPAFGGYSTEATATPLKIEVYEPMIPIPANPQAELDFAYTKAQAASGPTGNGVASWLWPGDPIGQGCKTFVEQLGLAQTGLCKDGYPVQVNSQTPGEPASQSDEPVPGSLMRTSSSPEKVSATVGWSPDCSVSDDQKSGGTPSLPGSPPGGFGAAVTGKQQTTAADDAPQGCLPPELAALVDVDGMVSDSHTETVGDTVTAVATSKLSNVSLLGGLITADSITVTSTTTADGKKPTASGVSKVTGLELAGKPLTFGRDGVRLADQKQALPGLPDSAQKALEQLGVQLVLPKPERSAAGDNASAGFQGLQIVLDTRPLRSHLNSIPFDEILGLIPDQAEKLRDMLGAATQLSPKFVITAGNTAAEASTVPKMDLSLPSVDASSLNGAAVPPSTGGTAGGSSGVAAGSAGAPPAALGGQAGAAPNSDPGALAARPMSSALPPLASIPGALMVGAFVIAAGVGWWLQKIGGLVLGGAAACSHGLETGVPDLRKA